MEMPTIVFQAIALRVLRKQSRWGAQCHEAAGWQRSVQEALWAPLRVLRGASEHLWVNGAKEEKRQALRR